MPSSVTAITLCQGNFRLMTDDLPMAIRHFAEQAKVFFVHRRDVRGTTEAFTETWHHDGATTCWPAWEAYRHHPTTEIEPSAPAPEGRS